MTDTKSPLDQVVEMLVYAPVGLAVAARELVPTLVERGRQQIDPQVGVARMVGQMAVSQGRKEAEKAVERALAQARATFQHLGLLPDEPETTARPGPVPAPPSEAPVPPPPRAARPVVTPLPGVASTPVPGVAGGTVHDAVTNMALAIPDYDSLSASQVVPRLSSLSPEELEAVRSYEQQHRGRKTILNRIVQIRAT